VTQPALALTSSDRVNEPELIARVLAGDRLAARELYDAHVGRVYRLAFRVTGDSQLAHEVTQDAFVKALSSLDRFRGDSALTTWLHRITVTVALNAVRRVKRLRGRETSIEDAHDVVSKDTADAVDPLLRDRLHRAIDALPEIYRTTLIMHEFEGYTHVEIADSLGIAVGTCKSRLSVARAQLRAALSDLAGEVRG
jgi:RNA polymerase sigma-70 factor, ECF subfamily